MLETHREGGLMQLRRDSTMTPRRLAVEEQLGHLLRYRGASFDQLKFHQVALQRARDGNRIDARMRPESAVLGGNRRCNQRWREVVRVQRHASGAVTRERFIQRNSIAIDDNRGSRVSRIEQPGWDWSEANPESQDQYQRRKASQRVQPRTRDLPPKGGSHKSSSIPLHRLISITAVAVRPNTSGSYISSARAGAVRNVPAVVARTM